METIREKQSSLEQTIEIQSDFFLHIQNCFAIGNSVKSRFRGAKECVQSVWISPEKGCADTGQEAETIAEHALNPPLLCTVLPGWPAGCPAIARMPRHGAASLIC